MDVGLILGVLFLFLMIIGALLTFILVRIMNTPTRDDISDLIDAIENNTSLPENKTGKK